jgi:hypothetical protein
VLLLEDDHTGKGEEAKDRDNGNRDDDSLTKVALATHPSAASTFLAKT